jgi:hypothetical protein
MAIAVQATSTTAFGTANNIALTKPTGTVDGDFLLAFIVNEGGQTITGVPSGWTFLQDDSEINGNTVRVYWKQASSEGASWTWTFNATTERMGGVIRIDGQKPTDPTDQNNENDVQNTRTPSYSNTITPTYTNSLLVMAIVANDTTNINSTSYAIATSNPTWTERIAMRDLGTGLAILVATAVRPEATATGNSSATIGDAGTPDSACILMSFIAIQGASGTAALLTTTPQIFTPTASAGATGTNALLQASPVIFDPTASEISPSNIWENTDKPAPGSITNTDKP